MKIRQLLVFFVAIVLSVSTVAYADSIDQRVRHAHERIDRGIRSGALTRDEAHSLKRQLNHIRETEARMLADGRLNHHERERLNSELNGLERRISAYKHNDDTRDTRHDDYRRHDGRGYR